MRAQALVAAAVIALLAVFATRAATLPRNVAATARGPGRCDVVERPAKKALGRPRQVRDFGAVGDGQHDDTAALRRALAALKPGDSLTFGPGRFVHAGRLEVTVPRVRLSGAGATLHATNPADQALLIQADGVSVVGFTLTAVTDRRRGAPWESRIAVWRPDGREVRDSNILDNRIVEHGEPGTPGANSSSSAAIFLHRATGFTVARNVVRRSLSDAIHVTGGSSSGRVVGNTVRESGDDMVAVVSYLPTPAERAKGLSTLVRDVLVAGNDVSGQYWGRGISVVGGESVTIQGNRVDATTHAAGIYIAREASWRTYGAHNVRIDANAITRVQTTDPAYSVLEPDRRGKRTGHAAIEVVAQVADDEPLEGHSARELEVHDIRITGNLIDDVATDGIRVAGWGYRSAIERSSTDGKLTKIGVTSTAVRRVEVIDNRIGRVRGKPLAIRVADEPAAAAVAVVGSTLRCDALR